MTTTDPTALTERIARALASDEGFDAGHPDHELVVGERHETAKALAPIIEAEVRIGKSEALREAADWWGAHPDDDAFETDADTRNWLRDRADDYRQKEQNR